MDFQSLIETYGYLAVALGTIIDHSGIPIPLVIAVYFCLDGILNIHIVVFIAFLVSLLSDLVLFYLGKHVGRRTAHKWGHKVGLTEKRILKIDQFIDTHHVSMIVFGRFYPIICKVAPFFYGQHKVSNSKFLVYSIIGNAIITYGFGYTAYILGKETLKHLGDYWEALAIFIGLLVLAQFLVIFLARKKTPIRDDECETN